MYINDERDRWRLVSYFDIVPAPLYELLYEDGFGLAERGTVAHRSPTIPLWRRDRCPAKLDTTASFADTDFDGTTPDKVDLMSGCPEDTDEDTGDTDGSSQVAEPWANICLHGAEGGCDAFSD